MLTTFVETEYLKQSFADWYGKQVVGTAFLGAIAEYPAHFVWRNFLAPAVRQCRSRGMMVV